jgi:flagella basal body P-ring formation protein FlgA
MVPARTIRAGAVIETRDLAKQLLVRRGQPVTVVIESGSVQLSEVAVARSNGGLGEMVTVERPGSRRQLAGRVVGPGKVKVE